jgi:hypothetical protein
MTSPRGDFERMLAADKRTEARLLWREIVVFVVVLVVGLAYSLNIGH